MVGTFPSGRVALKVPPSDVEEMHMSDLSNLLGDLYGDSRNPDGPPVRHEPAAAERSEWSPSRDNDDLAAALSAALAEPPAAPAPAPAPVMPAVQPAPAPAPVAVAPVAPVAPIAPVAPVAPVQEYPATIEHAVLVGGAGPRMWERGDDDIAPMGGVAKAKKKRK